MLCNFGVVRSAKFFERANCIFLAYFKGEERTVWKVLNKWQIFRENSFVNIVELFDNRSWKVEHFHSWNFESSTENHLEHWSYVAFVKNMRFNEAKSAVVQYGGRLHGTGFGSNTITKPESWFTFVWTDWIGSVTGILSSVSSKTSTDWARCLLLSILSVGRSNDWSPLCNSISWDQLHTNRDIAHHVAG